MTVFGWLGVYIAFTAIFFFAGKLKDLLRRKILNREPRYSGCKSALLIAALSGAILLIFLMLIIWRGGQAVVI